ncbi:MAG TPA: hypothetical protein VJN88_08375 [Ktedonobacterales bacterium]|nr:hypothetical protein [Ktedonobacterales bacterium]
MYSIAWSPIHNPAWDATPYEYVEAGLVGWGRSRRLARAADPSVALKAYLGLQHFDPARWMLPGEPTTKYFLSLFVAGRTISMRTFPTLTEALTALDTFYAGLSSGGQ